MTQIGFNNIVSPKKRTNKNIGAQKTHKSQNSINNNNNLENINRSQILRMQPNSMFPSKKNKSQLIIQKDDNDNDNEEENIDYTSSSKILLKKKNLNNDSQNEEKNKKVFTIPSEENSEKIKKGLLLFKLYKKKNIHSSKLKKENKNKSELIIKNDENEEEKKDEDLTSKFLLKKKNSNNYKKDEEKINKSVILQNDVNKVKIKEELPKLKKKALNNYNFKKDEEKINKSVILQKDENIMKINEEPLSQKYLKKITLNNNVQKEEKTHKLNNEKHSKKLKLKKPKLFHRRTNSENIIINTEKSEKTEKKQKNKKDERNNPSLPIKLNLQPKTEKIEYDLDEENKMKLKVEWTYIIDKNAKIKSDEDYPERFEKVEMIFTTNYMEKLILHWGVFRAYHDIEWMHPIKESIPENSIEFDKKAIQTEFIPDEKNEESTIKITLLRGKGFETVMGGINFVIMEPENNKWFNNFGNNYRIKFRLKKKKSKERDALIKRGVPVPDFVDDIIMCETLYESWSLMHRYNKCCEIIYPWNEKTLNEDWIWITIWLRYSYQRQLTWQRYYNTQPSELSRALNRLSMIITKDYAKIRLSGEDKFYNNLKNSNIFLLKYLLSILGKGQGNGQAVRDEILVIIHKNRIEPIHTSFYEQWHQKLHNNTTPDDVVICEALLAFLYSGNIEDYRNHLEKGGITKEIMASYERKITAEPYHNRSYIPDFERYLKLLKSVHSSTDLIETYEQCKYIIGDNFKLDDIIRSRNDIYVINQIRRVTEGREVLQEIIPEYLEDGNKLRDLLFFEISLEIYVRQLVEQIIHIELNYPDYIDEISYIMRNIKVSYPNYSEFNLCHEDWFNIVENYLKNDYSKEAAKKVQSVVSRINRLLANIVDYYNKNFEPRATYFGNECALEKFAINTFTEELIRGTIFFTLSMLLKKIDPIIRKNGEFSDWLIISRGAENNIRGKMIYIENLNEVQFTKYPEKTIILTENVMGEEEIPVNCCGLIIIKNENYPDILSHVSVRARNLNILFAVCFNEEKTKNLLELLNKKVEINIQNQEVFFQEGFWNSENNDVIENQQSKKVKLMKIDDKYKKIYLELSEFENTNVGQKSNNTKKLFKNIIDCDWLKYPESFAIPFNVQEYFMSLDENKLISEEIDKNIKKIKCETNKEIITDLLKKCKDLTMKLNFIENSETIQLKKRLIEFGIKEEEFNYAFEAIKSVWASKFNERAFLATSKIGITISDIKMAVLCQKIIPAEYSYVLHTKNPSTNNQAELFGEICVGMGEALVGAYEGQPLSFEFYKNENKYELKTLPNKSIALKNEGFIFRSDSNTEDLEGFSGAGLFDSFPMVKNKEIEICYHNDKIFFDGRFRDYVVRKIAEVGIAVEKYFGSPQDIEGVFYDNNFYIVQTRPQV